MTYLAFFLLGVGFGGAVGTYLIYIHFEKNVVKDTEILLKEVREKIATGAQNLELLGSLKYRISQVNDMSLQQTRLLDSLNKVSQSEAQNIVLIVKDLEHRKFTIFKSMLDDGVDSEVKVLTPQGEKMMKMSEALALYESNQTPKNTDSRPVSRSLKLVTNEGDEDELKNPTLH